MRRRKRLSRKASRRSFTKNATRIHKYNTRGTPMRGGIRL